MTAEMPTPQRRTRPDRTFRGQTLGVELSPSADPPSSSTGDDELRVRSQPSPMWRRVGFAVLVVALVASIPALGAIGVRLVTSSTDGKFSDPGVTPQDPGYQELVTSTPTALVVQTDREGALVGVTLLALGAESGGGTVIFMPIDARTTQSLFGIDRLAAPYSLPSTSAADKQDLVTGIAAGLLNVGIDEVIALDSQGWENLTAPVAPFEIENLDFLDIEGSPLDAGPTDIDAGDVGPYLAAIRPDEGQDSRIARQEQLWRGWLAAVAASDLDDAVPGETGSGMGLFARTLAAGSVRYVTLPGAQADDPGDGYRVDALDTRDLVAEAIPVPDAASPGSRQTVRLLNGVSPGPIPLDITRQVTALDGSVTVVGNGPDFGRQKTTVVYAEEADEGFAEDLGRALGVTGSVSRRVEAPDDLDVTVVLGTDLLGAPPSGSQAPTTTDEPANAQPSGGT